MENFFDAEKGLYASYIDEGERRGYHAYTQAAALLACENMSKERQKTLSEILGHASPTITLNTYSHSLPEHKKKEMNRLGKMYNPSK